MDVTSRGPQSLELQLALKHLDTAIHALQNVNGALPMRSVSIAITELENARFCINYAYYQEQLKKKG